MGRGYVDSHYSCRDMQQHSQDTIAPTLAKMRESSSNGSLSNSGAVSREDDTVISASDGMYTC